MQNNDIPNQAGCQYHWVCGYLSAFEHVNDRRNAPSHYQFERVIQTGSLEETIRNYLGHNAYPCRDIRKISMSAVDCVTDELSSALQMWLFDFMFYEITNKAPNTVWVDPTRYFNLSVAQLRTEKAKMLSAKILGICNPCNGFRVGLETGERKWYEHGCNFLFTNATQIWWLRLGEVF